MERQVYYIYQIFYKGHIYVGATNNLKRRQSQHRHNCFNMLRPKFSRKVYKKLRQLGIKREEINLQLLEKIVNITKQESKGFERKWKDLLKADLNTQVPGRTHKEYDENNRESINKNKKIYYQNNKEDAKQYQREYRQKNKEHIKQKDRERYQKRKNQNSTQSESLSES